MVPDHSLDRLQAISATQEFCKHIKRISITVPCDFATLDCDVPPMCTEAFATLTQCFSAFSTANAARKICVGAEDDGRGFEVVSSALAASCHVIDSLSLCSWRFALVGSSPLAPLCGQEMDRLCALWSNLTHLEIALHEHSTYPKNLHNLRLRRVLMSATRLETLTLNGAVHFIRTKLRTVRRIFPASPLRKLSLVSVDTSEIDLLWFLSNYRATLSELTLSGVTLLSEAEAGWSSVMKHLDSTLDLTSFKADDLTRYNDEVDYMFGDEHGSLCFRYAGANEDVSVQLNELAQKGHELGYIEADSFRDGNVSDLRNHEGDDDAEWSDQEGVFD